MKQKIPNSSDFLWGAKAIGDYLGLDDFRKVYNLVKLKRVPATKLGPKLIVGRKSELDRVGLGKTKSDDTV